MGEIARTVSFILLHPDVFRFDMNYGLEEADIALFWCVSGDPTSGYGTVPC